MQVAFEFELKLVIVTVRAEQVVAYLKRVARVERERSVQVVTFVRVMRLVVRTLVQLHVVQMVVRVRDAVCWPIAYVNFERVLKRVLRMVERFRLVHFVRCACATVEACVCVQQTASRGGRVC